MNTHSLSAPLYTLCKKIWGVRLFAVPQSSADRGAPDSVACALMKGKSAACRLVKAPALPSGYRLHVANLRVDVPYHRRPAAQAFAQGADLSIELEAGNGNSGNATALKVIGVEKSRRTFIGLIPSGITADIAERGLRNQVRAQRDHISQGVDGFITVVIQIIVPETLQEDSGRWLELDRLPGRQSPDVHLSAIDP